MTRIITILIAFPPSRTLKEAFAWKDERYPEVPGHWSGGGMKDYPVSELGGNTLCVRLEL